jgi:ABC-type nitrate/sulfonate/bicarbonate transport system permease component
MRFNKNYIPIISVICGFLIFFELAPLLFENSPFATFHEILTDLRKEDKVLILKGLYATFFRFVIATVLGYVIGIVLSIPMLISKTLGNLLNPWYTVLRITPAIVWIPILLSFRSLHTSQIPIIISVIFASLYVHLYVNNALKEISEEELIYMKAIKASKKWKLLYCYMPRILYSSVYGIKIGGSIALILVVVGEALVSVEPSLGYLISSYQTTMEKNGFWLTFIVLALLAIIVFTILNRIATFFGANGNKE